MAVPADRRDGTEGKGVSVQQRAPLQAIGDRVPAQGERVSWLLGRGTPPGDREAFFVWQERALDYLLAWGVGNMLAGTTIAIVSSGIPRAIGIQAALWGTVESAVALYGMYSARQFAVAARSGYLSAEAVRSEAKRFGNFLAMNTVADVAYLAGGITVAVKSKRPRVRGAAIGVAIQGGALLLYDTVLTARTILRPERRHRGTPLA